MGPARGISAKALAGLGPEEINQLMTTRTNQQDLAQRSVASIMQGLQLPEIERGRVAERRLAEARTAEFGDKVDIITPQGVLKVSPDKAADYAIKDMGLGIEQQRVNLQRSLNAANIALAEAETDEKRAMLQPKIAEMNKRLEQIDSQMKYTSALIDEVRGTSGKYRQVTSGDPKDVDPVTGFPNMYNVEVKDLMSINAGLKKAYITVAEKQAALAAKQEGELVKRLDRLTDIETKFYGRGQYQGDPENKKNPANIPKSRDFNKESSTPYLWLWDRDDKELKQVPIPPIPAEEAYKLAGKPMPPEMKGKAVQFRAKDVYKNSGLFDFFIVFTPEFMKKYGVKNADDFRDSLL